MLCSELGAHPSPSPTTPPIAFKKATFDTPLRSSSASQRGIEQTYDEVGQRFLEELTGRIYYEPSKASSDNLRGSWTNNGMNIYETLRVQYTEDSRSGWPESSLQSPFLESFVKFQDSVIGGLRYRHYTSVNKVVRAPRPIPSLIFS